MKTMVNYILYIKMYKMYKDGSYFSVFHLDIKIGMNLVWVSFGFDFWKVNL